MHVFQILPPVSEEGGRGSSKKKESRHRLKRLQLLAAPHLVDNIEVRWWVGGWMDCVSVCVGGGLRLV